LQVIGGVVQRGLRSACPVIARHDYRTVLHRRLAAGNDFRLHRHRAVRLALSHLDQAHAARRHHRERLVVAVMGNGDAGAIGGLDAIEPGRTDLDRNVVHINRRHRYLIPRRWRSPSGSMSSIPWAVRTMCFPNGALASYAHTSSRVFAALITMS